MDSRQGSLSNELWVRGGARRTHLRPVRENMVGYRSAAECRGIESSLAQLCVKIAAILLSNLCGVMG